MSARRDAAKHLGFALQAKYRDLVEATGPDEISNAAVVLGALFNENIEFVIWVLKEYGGVQQLPFERVTLPTTPAVFTKQ